MRIFLALALVIGVFTQAQAQVLRPGDQLDISVWQDPKLDRRVIVTPAGTISFPLAGHIKAGGMTPQALEEALRARLRNNYTERLDITVALSGRRDDDETTPRIYVTGEILKPGPYLIKVKTNIMQAIALAGGLGPFAAKQRIQIRRQVNGIDEILTFDYKAYEAGRDFSGNIELRSGDVVIIPERGLFELF